MSMGIIVSNSQSNSSHETYIGLNGFEKLENTVRVPGVRALSITDFCWV